MTFDLVIRGGKVIDGTGAAPRTADIAVRDGLIAEVGRVSTGAGVAQRTIDADGLFVTPGFVDDRGRPDRRGSRRAHRRPAPRPRTRPERMSA